MQTTRRIHWTPHDNSSRFAVASANDIRLYDCQPDGAGINQVAVCADLPNIRTFAWSAHNSINDLVAVGLATGRTLLLRLNDSNQITSNSVNAVSLNVRHARPCTAVAFGPNNLLAVGLEKARDHGLLVYDVETSARQFESSASSTPFSPQNSARPSFAKMQATSSSPAPEVRPLLQFGSSESVSAATFLHSGTYSPCLAAGMGAAKWIRIFDLRAKNAAASQLNANMIYATRSVLGIAADPFDGNRFASYGDDALVRIWDTRKTVEPVLSFSEVDAGEGRADRKPAQLLNILFSPTNRGLLATCESNTTACRLWNITSGEASDHASPLLLSHRRGPAFSRAPSSVVFARSLGNNAQTLASVSKEGQVELVKLPDPARVAFSFDSELAITAQPEHSPHIIPSHQSRSNDDKDALSYSDSVTISSKVQRLHLRGRSNSGRSLGSRQEDTTGDEQPSRSKNSISATLESDQSVLIRNRIAQGYNCDPNANAGICSDSLQKFWSWIAHAQYVASSAGQTYTEKYDFAFVGVEGVLRGLPPLTSKKQGAEDRKMSEREDREYNTVVDRINRMHESSSSIAASTKIQGRRKLALSLCGYDFMSGDTEQLVRRLEMEGNITRAAAYAMFTGNTSEAISALRNSEDDRLKLLAPTLASYLSQQRRATNSPADTSMFKEICGNLSTELEDAYLRAIFAFLSSSSWQDVLEEEAMALVDRLSVALRFLNDDELMRYITKLSEHAISSGDLEGLVLTGLTTSGFTLIQNYLDRSGDVQTAALAATMVHPARIPDARAERWIWSYRKLLDQWKLYSARAKFDIARGARMRQTQATLKLAGKSDSIVTVFHPARQFVRCNFCNLTVSTTTSALNKTKRRGKATTCPSCSKGFPRCSICLDNMTIPELDSAIPPVAWTWCSICRHGGHAAHLQEWFESGQTECPVPSCTCLCDG